MYMELKKIGYMSSVKTILATNSIHCEKRLGERDQARHYCMKPVEGCACEHCGKIPPPIRVEGPYEVGVWREVTQGARSDLQAVIADIQSGARSLGQIARDHPLEYVKYSRGIRELFNMQQVERGDPPDVILHYGPPRCGKSRLARADLPKEEYWVDNADSTTWFDGYDGQRRAIFDDYDGYRSGGRLKVLLRITDDYALRVPVKGSFVNWIPEEIVITTNYHPRDWFDWSNLEQQYPALWMRFTRVVYWRRARGAQKPWEVTSVTIGPGTDLWTRFWKGPQHGAVATLGRFEQWRELFIDDDYDFMPGPVVQSEPSSVLDLSIIDLEGDV